MYNTIYNPQVSLERINAQINELEKMKQQMQQPTSLTQNFQIAPGGQGVMKYVNSLEDVNREVVYYETPYFSKDMAVLWVKKPTNEVKTYELKEIIEKDEKDVQIEFLMAQIEGLKKEMRSNAKSNDDDVDEPIKSEKSTSISNDKSSKTKSK